MRTKKVNLKRQEWLEAGRCLDGLSKMKIDINLSFIIASNMRKLFGLIADINKEITFSEDSDEFREYMKYRTEAGKRHAKKDDEGKPLYAGRGLLLADPDAYQRDIAEWLEEGQPDLEGRIKEHNEKAQEFLEGEWEVEVYTMPLWLFPKELEPNVFGPCIEWIVSEEPKE
jgi:hypothetical protein